MKNLIRICLFTMFLFVTGDLAAQNIHLSTPRTSLVLSAPAGGELKYVYYGSKLTENDCREVYNAPTMQHAAYPVYGMNCPGESALAVTHADGNMTLQMEVAGTEIKNTDGAVTAVIKLKDKVYPFSVNVCYKAYSDVDIIETWTEIAHAEKKNVMLRKFDSAFLPVRRGDVWLSSLYGSWANEGRLVQEPLEPGMKVIKNRDGVRNSHTAHAEVMFSLDGKPQENYGNVIGAALCYGGNYKLRIDTDDSEYHQFYAGINEENSVYNLKKGELFITPALALTYSAEGLSGCSRNFHRWARKYKLAHGNSLRKILLNSWEGVYFDINENGMNQMMGDIASMGGELFVMDDGWFGDKYKRNSDNSSLGDWKVDTGKLPGGIRKLVDDARQYKVKFGIWIEPEMANTTSELYEKHPEWIVRSGNRELLLVRSQCVLDLTNPEVQDFIVETFDDIVSSSSNISYIKWDSNRFINRAGSEYLPADKQSHFWVDYINGLYSVYDRVRKKYPHITIQLCSSGGGRLDFGALKYHDEVWASDNTNPLSRIFIQYGTNMFFPAIATGAHVSISPNHQTKMHASLKYRFDVAMAGRLGMELQPEDLQGDERVFAKNAIETYKQIRPIVQFGDLYRLVSPYDEGGWAASMYVDKDKKNAVVFAYSFEFHGRDCFLEFKLDGLDEKKKYKLTELNRMGKKSSFWGNDKIFTGEELMKMGINVNDSAMFDSFVFMITEVN